MRARLFVPCYVEQLRPGVAGASLSLLRRAGLEVAVDERPVCCGQPLYSAGDLPRAAALLREAAVQLAGTEPVVCPSSSCAAMLRHRPAELLPAGGAGAALAPRVFEIAEFLHRLPAPRRPEGRFPHRVSIHPACHGLRELGLGSSSESLGRRPDPVRELLAGIEGLELAEPARADVCCGFGGPFVAAEAALSRDLGRERVRAHLAAGSEVVVSTDASCLLHLESSAPPEAAGLRFLHLAELLEEAAA